MTDPTGCCFLSYRRSRSDEAGLLVSSLREHGVPTWRDVDQLAEGPTEEELRRVLRDPATASAILWITPEVEHSDIIRLVEAPLLLERAGRGDDFYLVPVAAGGLDYEEAAAALQGQTTLEDLRLWNLRKVGPNPIGEADADDISQRVVSRRLQAIHRRHPEDEPLTVGVYTRVPPTPAAGEALSLDWSRLFDERLAAPEAWQDRIVPCLRRLVTALRTGAPGRAVLLQGRCSLSTALVLGRAFLEPGGLSVCWRQSMIGGSDQHWGLGVDATDSGFSVDIQPRDPSSLHLAVMVSVAEDVERAVAASASLPSFRAHVHVSKKGVYPHVIGSPSEAVGLARLAAAAMRRARSEFPEVRVGHLFLAAPAGVALMIGQLTNTFGSIQTYEHVESDLVGHYRPAARLGHGPIGREA